MEIYQEFIETSSLTAEILELYMELRMFLKEWGYTDESIKKIHSAPGQLWALRNKLQTKIEKLWGQLNDYGVHIPRDLLNSYLATKFYNIDKIIPLNDGNNERDNSRDEDFE